VYFNERFGVSAIAMHSLGVFNPDISIDNKMFVDPKLLEAGKDEFEGSHEELIGYFDKTAQLVKLIRSETDSDMAWTAAWKRMRFKETTNTALGFSKDGTDGNGIGAVLAKQIINRAAEILPHVDYAPDVFELIGVFAERLGCDRLSDMIVSILKARFLAYTDRITKSLKIDDVTNIEHESLKYACPNLGRTGRPLILVPQDLLKPLPIAASIEDALAMADLNDTARREVNKIYALAHEARRSAKPYLRNLIRENTSLSKGIVAGYKRARPTPYDYDRDPNHVASFIPIAREIVGESPARPSVLEPMDRVEACVEDVVGHVQKSLEHNRLGEFLYDDSGNPRREVVSQRLIYTISEIFAKQYDVDCSREANAGPGAVDFRFTVGHGARLLIEVKLSSHPRLKDGYYEQLPAYAQAEQIRRLILLIIRVSTDDSHLKALTEAIKKKELPIQLVVMDAVPRPPASKRVHRPDA
jgi:hypothetical protein